MGRKSGGLLVFLALAVLVLPLRWLGAAILAGAVHEACHWGAVRLCGGEVRRLSAGFSGAEMTVEGLDAGRELLCALAGPVGGLMLLGLSRFLPRTALCAGFQSLYNLLPVYPLDGGRALRCLCALVLPGRAGERVCEAVRHFCLAGIGCLGLYGTLFLHLGLMPLLLAIAIIVRVGGMNGGMNGKIPCKTGAFSVQ